ncbi:MAG: hypothetical protein AB7U20_02615 [Planctomycetaceae bacterium]
MFTGRRLALNYSTSAAGSVRVEIQNADGEPIPGYALTDVQELYGDSTDQQVVWNDDSDVSRLSGNPVRLRFVSSDADVFSYRFHE